MLTEVKQFKEQREEVRHWERMREEKVSYHCRKIDQADKVGRHDSATPPLEAIPYHARDHRLDRQGGRGESKAREPSVFRGQSAGLPLRIP